MAWRWVGNEISQHWINAGLFPVRLLETNFGEIISIQENVFESVSCQNGSHFVQGGWALVPGICGCNRPGAQIPQCTSPISHNAPFYNRNVHTCAHFCYKNGALWDICLMHCGICEMGLFKCNIQTHFIYWYLVRLFLGECHITPLMINQHWFW